MSVLVLVVDDEPDVEALFRQQFRRDLRSQRFVMEFAASAADTIYPARSNRCARGPCAGSPQRWPSVPEFPAIAETVPGFEAVGFYGISAPKGTPSEIIEILNKAVGEALKDPKVVARLADLGGLPMPMTPAEFGKLVADETDKWRKVVEFAGVSVD